MKLVGYSDLIWASDTWKSQEEYKPEKNTVAERRARYRGPYLSENLKFGK